METYKGPPGGGDAWNPMDPPPTAVAAPQRAMTERGWPTFSPTYAAPQRVMPQRGWPELPPMYPAGTPVELPPTAVAPQMPPPPVMTLGTTSTPASQWLGSHPEGFGAGDRVTKPVYTPDKYDGSGYLGEYLAHFDMCRCANGWSNAQAGLFLGLSLTGKARRLLTGKETASAEGYMHLRAALVARFQPTNQSSMYKALLRTKDRAKGDCLQSHAEDIERLTRLAYPNADVNTIDVMAKDRFVESLKDAQLQQWVHQGKPDTLTDAVQSALHAEACLRPHGKVETARAVNSTVAEAMDAIREEMKKDRAEGRAETAALRQVLSSQGSSAGGKTGRGVPRPANRGPLRCWHCGEMGHIREKCAGWLGMISAADKRRSGGPPPAPAPQTAAPQPAAPQPSEN